MSVSIAPSNHRAELLWKVVCHHSNFTNIMGAKPCFGTLIWINKIKLLSSLISLGQQSCTLHCCLVIYQYTVGQVLSVKLWDCACIYIPVHCTNQTRASQDFLRLFCCMSKEAPAAAYLQVHYGVYRCKCSLTQANFPANANVTVHYRWSLLAAYIQGAKLSAICTQVFEGM